MRRHATVARGTGAAGGVGAASGASAMIDGESSGPILSEPTDVSTDTTAAMAAVDSAASQFASSSPTPPATRTLARTCAKVLTARSAESFQNRSRSATPRSCRTSCATAARPWAHRVSSAGCRTTSGAGRLRRGRGRRRRRASGRRPLAGSRVVVQGFGAVGAVPPGASPSWAPRWSPCPPRPGPSTTGPAWTSRHSFRPRSSGGDGLVHHLPGADMLPAGQELLLDCDVLVPGDAGRGRRRHRRAPQGRHCGGGGQPAGQPAGLDVLRERGVVVVPDFIANAGGIVAAAFAMDARYSVFPVEREPALDPSPHDCAPTPAPSWTTPDGSL